MTEDKKNIKKEKAQVKTEPKKEKAQVKTEPKKVEAQVKTEPKKEKAQVKTEPKKVEATQKEAVATEAPSAQEAEAKEAPKKENSDVKIAGLFAFKEGMTSIYDEAGKKIPVTVLRYEPMVISQIKTRDKEGYTAVQTAFVPQSVNKVNKTDKGHFKKAGFERGFCFVKEVRTQEDKIEGLQLGQYVDINSLVKGDKVKITSRTKGRGFQGVVKRYNFGGGPASHGSKSFRRVGSIGSIRSQGRVFKGKKMPGQYGDKNYTRKNVLIVDILTDEKVILVKGQVAGARSSLVSLIKM